MADVRNIAVCGTALGDGAILTADSEALGAEAAHLQTSQPGEVWRTNWAVAAGVDVDLGSAQDVAAVALLYTNVTDSATWDVRGAASAAELGTTPLVSVAQACRSTLVRDARGWRHALVYLATPALSAVTARYWRIAISDPTNPDGYLEAGRLVVSDPWRPELNLDRGWRLVRRDPSEHVRMSRGQLRVLDHGGGYDELTFRLSWLSRAEAYQGLAPRLDALRGGASGDLLVIRDPTAPDWDAEAVYGPPASVREIEHPHRDYYATEIRITERIP